MVLMPMPLLDQPMVARSVADAGAADRIEALAGNAAATPPRSAQRP